MQAEKPREHRRRLAPKTKPSAAGRVSAVEAPSAPGSAVPRGCLPSLGYPRSCIYTQECGSPRPWGSLRKRVSERLAGSGLVWAPTSWLVRNWEGRPQEQEIVWAEGAWPHGRTLRSQCAPREGNSGLFAGANPQGTSSLGHRGASSGTAALHGGQGRALARYKKQVLLRQARFLGWGPWALSPVRCPGLALSWVFTDRQDVSSNVPGFPGPRKVGEVGWQAHLYMLQT